MSDLTFGANHVTVKYCALADKDYPNPCKHQGTYRCRLCKVMGKYLNYEGKYEERGNMKTRNKNSVSVILIALSAIFGRMGGAKGYNKLWRRLGCSITSFAILFMFCTGNALQWVISYGLLLWASVSYMGFINKLLAKDCKYCALGENHKSWVTRPNYYCRYCEDDLEYNPTCTIDQERWYQFLFEALVFQYVILPFRHDWVTILIATGSAFIATYGKIQIDESRMNKKDVISELFFWGAMALGLFVNCKF